MKPTRVIIILLMGIFSLCGLWLRNSNGPDWSNPLDLGAVIIAGLVLFTVIVLLVVDFIHLRRSWEMPEPEDPPRSADPVRPRDEAPSPAPKPLEKPTPPARKPVNDADRVVQEAEEFVDRAMNRIQIDIDVEDSRDD